jgi:hypothetical protein
MTDLSPNAQAVLNAAFSVYDCEALYSLTEEQHASMIAAAALRKAAGYLFPNDTAKQCYDRLLAIATELENQ